MHEHRHSTNIHKNPWVLTIFQNARFANKTMAIGRFIKLFNSVLFSIHEAILLPIEVGGQVIPSFSEFYTKTL